MRKVFLPKTVSMALTEEKDRQQRAKEMLDSDYQDFGLVIAHEDGRPYEERQIAFLLRKLTDATGLPPVVFHSLRHCSASLKLQIGGGNIKAVQGDTPTVFMLRIRERKFLSLTEEITGLSRNC